SPQVSARMEACVPFPAPGGPKRAMRMQNAVGRTATFSQDPGRFPTDLGMIRKEAVQENQKTALESEISLAHAGSGR
ncbi:MAG: hypothetical protein ACI80V_003814, partial [Rhodothermales bacterium]